MTQRGDLNVMEQIMRLWCMGVPRAGRDVSLGASAKGRQGREAGKEGRGAVDDADELDQRRARGNGRVREGEWFQKWEGTIKRAVAGRLKTNQPLTDPDMPNSAALLLDGYRV